MFPTRKAEDMESQSPEHFSSNYSLLVLGAKSSSHVYSNCDRFFLKKDWKNSFTGSYTELSSAINIKMSSIGARKSSECKKYVSLPQRFGN